LIMDFRDVTGTPEQTLDRATEHLGLPRFERYPEIVKRNVTGTHHSGAPPSVADIERLVSLYADDLADFSKLTGMDLSSWSTQRVIDGDLDLEEFTDTIGRKLGLIR
jgi:hypothetical protein